MLQIPVVLILWKITHTLRMYVQHFINIATYVYNRLINIRIHSKPSISITQYLKYLKCSHPPCVFSAFSSTFVVADASRRELIIAVFVDRETSLRIGEVHCAYIVHMQLNCMLWLQKKKKKKKKT